MELRVSDSSSSNCFQLHTPPRPTLPSLLLSSLLRASSSTSLSTTFLPLRQTNPDIPLPPPAKPALIPPSIRPPRFSLPLFRHPALCLRHRIPCTSISLLCPVVFSEFPVLPDDRSCPGQPHPPRWIVQTCGPVEQSRSHPFSLSQAEA
jgi:hypothetical protein